MSFDPTSLAAPGVARLTPYQPGKPVEELEREYGVSDALKLASNENPLGPSPKATRAMQALLQDKKERPDHALEATMMHEDLLKVLGQSLTDWAFRVRVYVGWVAGIDGDRHLNTGELGRQSTLSISKQRPRLAFQGRQLNKQKRQIRLLPQATH